MPLRIEALPRMAGHLTFMRAPVGAVSNLEPGMIAALGIPVDARTDAGGATRFGPFALRETSAYFGSHFASNMKAAMDVDRRRVLDGAVVAGRLVDLGDLGCIGMTAAEQSDAIEGIVAAVVGQGAVPLVLGGDDGVLPAVLAGLAGAGANGGGTSPLALIAFGLDVLPGWRGGPLIHLVPTREPSAEALRCIAESGGFLARSAELRELRATAVMDRLAGAVGGAPVHVALDMSGFAATWHGMHQRAPFDGLSLSEARELLEAIGTLPIAGLSITGLDPTGSGLSVVKTGQRLILTAILDLIYARLDALRSKADTTHA